MTIKINTGFSDLSKTNLFKPVKKQEGTKLPDNNEKTEKSVRQEILEKIKEALDPTGGMTDEEKQVYQKKIGQKIKNGEKLSPSEMRYIQMTSPEMYIHVKRVQMQREMLEKKLEHCKSKKEVEEAYTVAVSYINKDDPDREALLSAYHNVTLEFKKSDKYKALPEEVKEEDKVEKKKEKDMEDILDTIDLDTFDSEVFSFDMKA